MQKKTQLLKWAVPLLTLLVVGVASFSTEPFVAKADSSNSKNSSSSSSISDSDNDPRRCNNSSNNNVNGSISIEDDDGGSNNSSSGLPDSDCNSNTPAPSPGSCQLAWMDGGGGSTELNADQVTDQGLKDTLKGTGTALPPGYNLKCADDVKASSCKLVPGDNGSGDTELDLANVENRSPWIYENLLDKYGLNCDDNGDDDDDDNEGGKINKSKSSANIKSPQFSKTCGFDKSRNQGSYYSMRIGRVPGCSTVRWTFDSAVTKGKTCTFSTSWYGGHSWVMNVFTSDNPNTRAYAFLINGSAFTKPLRDVSRIEVGMGKDVQYGASADLKNQDLHVGSITASNCKA